LQLQPIDWLILDSSFAKKNDGFWPAYSFSIYFL
jgi:hypothetical protein